MRVLLAHNSLYFPSHGGGDKSNRLLMEALGARGHEVRVVARLAQFGEAPERRFLESLGARGLGAEVEDGVARMTLHGVDVHTLTTNPRLRAYLTSQIESFDPDVIITSTDDPAQLLFEAAIHSERAKVVYLVRATIAVPFGPDASTPSAERTEALKRADGIVGVSEYVARYVREWGGIPAIHLPISLMDPGENPDVGRFDNPYVTIVNPCAVKGIDIFLAVAERLPDVRFAAVPTWGTNAEDRARLERAANVTVLPPVDNIDDLMRQTRVLLAPSIWAEARSRIIVEAMARGVPVIASDVGGIPEAKLGTPYLLPVNPIRSYRPAFDENMVPIAERPAQDVQPWERAVRRLTTDAAHWREVSTASRNAALAYLSNLSVEPFERYLLDLAPGAKKQQAVAAGGRTLSDEKRRLLAARLRHGTTKRSKWFPTAEDAKPGQRRLFCFPHAGGGALQFRAWTNQLGECWAVTPAWLPGREARAAEPAIDNMAEMVAALVENIRPWLDRPFALFGHSMGAGIGFELARALRRNGLPAPEALIASAARAPQYRQNNRPGPEPSDDDLCEELRRLEGLPPEILQNRQAMQFLIPVLRADTRLYRNYTYSPEPPFDFPIFAYGTAGDPNLRTEHIERWREQTTGRFLRRQFEGGHFFIQSERDTVLAALREDLASLTRE